MVRCTGLRSSRTAPIHGTSWNTSGCQPIHRAWHHRCGATAMRPAAKAYRFSSIGMKRRNQHWTSKPISASAGEECQRRDGSIDFASIDRGRLPRSMLRSRPTGNPRATDPLEPRTSTQRRGFWWPRTRGVLTLVRVGFASLAVLERVQYAHRHAVRCGVAHLRDQPEAGVLGCSRAGLGMGQ